MATKCTVRPTPLIAVPSSSASDATAPVSVTIMPVLIKRACLRWAQYNG